MSSPTGSHSEPLPARRTGATLLATFLIVAACGSGPAERGPASPSGAGATRVRTDDPAPSHSDEGARSGPEQGARYGSKAQHTSSAGPPSEEGVDSPSSAASVSGPGHATAPTDPQLLEGPFASLQDYLDDRAMAHDPSCGPRPRASTSPTRLGGRGSIREARLVRLPDSIACAPVEYCALGLRTAEGWFVHVSRAPCHGVVGPDRSTTLAARGRWVSAASGPVLAVEETRRTESREYSDAGGEKHERTSEHESRYLRLCGVGSSGKPSCTDFVVVSCPRSDGTTSEVAWSLGADRLTLESASDPASACAMDEPFVVGDYPLTFP